jgi:D-alanine-D-alanine ligase
VKTAVLMGGVSSEREVSLRSGAAVAGGLRARGHTVHEAVVEDRTLASLGDVTPDVVFIALHGAFGEDGEVQGLLDARGLRYTGAGPEASRRALDKLLTKETFASAGVPTPPYVAFSREDADADALAATLGYPVVVKPANEGSSVGVAIARDREGLGGAIERALSFGPRGLAERHVAGKELHVGILGSEALPVVWVRPAREFYDYEAKYGQAGTVYVCPAPLDAAADAAVRDAAQRAFAALGCRHFGRVDILLASDGTPFVLEVNTIPGFTETSLLPKAAAAAGIPFPELCDTIARMAREE